MCKEDRCTYVWDFLHAADTMLYRIKKEGRNNYGITDLHTIENDKESAN